MGELSNAEVMRRVWDLYSTGRLAEILDHLDPDVEWHTALLDEVYRGREDLARWARDTRRGWKSLTVIHEKQLEVADDCIVTFARVVAFDHNGESSVDSPLALVAEFRDGRIARAHTFLDRDEALAWVSARP